MRLEIVLPTPSAFQTEDVAVKLIDKRRNGERRDCVAHFIKAEVEILSHPIHSETNVTISRNHGLVPLVQFCHD